MPSWRFSALGVALFGLLLLTSSPLILGYFSLLAGCVIVAAVVPDLAVVLVILIFRLANQAPWPAAAQTLGIGVALVALLACAIVLVRAVSASLRSVVMPLQLSQASIALLSISLGQADGRFAAVVLLILLILTRAATRIMDEPIAALAIAGLAGVPPLGVFPGLVLVVMAVGHHDPWLLLPLGAAFIPMVMTSLPRRLAAFSSDAPSLLSKAFNVSSKAEALSIGWLPLLLALMIGYFAPDGFVRWCHMLTAGHG